MCSSRQTIASSLATIILLVTTCSLQAAMLDVAADTTWQAIGPVGDSTGGGINNVGLAWEALNVGWNTSPSYDDSASAGWTNAIEVVHPNPPFLRYWVDGTETMGSSPAYFRKGFEINGTPTDGSLDFIVDDDAKVYINGNLVIDDSNSLATFFTNVDVTSALQQGTNLIAIKAHDAQGAQSINFDLAIMFTETVEPPTVPEPSTFVLGILGFLSMCLVGRRRRRRT